MSLLEEIQDAAVDSKSDLGEVLRKCKVLAAGLDSQPLEDWLVWESNGYPKEVKVPAYREWPLELKGNFSGPFQSGLRNASIPKLCVPEEYRDTATNFRCRQSIASIEEVVKQSDDGTLKTTLGDLLLVLGMEVYRDMNCIQVWGEFSIGYLVEVLNTVRNRILDFSLALWKENPGAGDPKSSSKIEPQKVNQIFNTVVYGGATSVVGTAVDSSFQLSVVNNDFESLARALTTCGVDSDDLDVLQQAINDDPKPAVPNKFGPKVSRWIANMIGKAASGIWDIGIEAAGSLLATSISRFYGLS